MFTMLNTDFVWHTVSVWRLRVTTDSKAITPISLKWQVETCFGYVPARATSRQILSSSPSVGARVPNKTIKSVSHITSVERIGAWHRSRGFKNILTSGLSIRARVPHVKPWLWVESRLSGEVTGYYRLLGKDILDDWVASGPPTSLDQQPAASPKTNSDLQHCPMPKSDQRSPATNCHH